MSRRLERVAESIKQAVAGIIQKDLADPRVIFVSVTNVEVSADLRSARVLVSVLGEKSKIDAALDALHGARGFVQAELGRKLPLKYIPYISFHHDRGIENAFRVTQILEELQAEREKTDVGNSE